MRQLYLDDLDAHLRYHDLPGRMPARVFLHGLGCASSADFPHIAADVRLGGHRTLLVDLLGFGFSDRPAHFGYTLADHAAIVARLLDHLALSGCHVVGHSMGGSIAAVLADRRPDLVSHVIVSEGNLDPGGGSASTPIAAQAEADYVASGHAATIAAYARQSHGGSGTASFAARLQAADPIATHRSARALVAMPPPTVREILLRLPIRRTLLWGARSLPDPAVDSLARAGIPLVIIPDAGHDLMNDNPDAYSAALAAILAG